MTTRITLAGLCLVLLHAGPSLAATGNAPGKLGVEIVASDSTDFIDEWMTTHYKHAVTIRRIHELAPGKLAHVAFIVTGFTRGKDGRPHVAIDVCVRRPDGSIAYQESAFASLTRRTDDRIGFCMAGPTLEFGVDNSDPLGPWRVEALAHDRLRGTKSTASYVITVRK